MMRSVNTACMLCDYLKGLHVPPYAQAAVTPKLYLHVLSHQIVYRYHLQSTQCTHINFHVCLL